MIVQMKCPKCGTPFSVDIDPKQSTRDAKGKNPKERVEKHVVACPKCKTTAKVDVTKKYP